MTETTQNVAPEAPVEVTNENVDQLLEQEKTGEVPAEEVVKEEKREQPNVPLGALHEERMKRRSFEAKTRELESQLAQQMSWRQQNEQILNERLNALQRQPELPSSGRAAHQALTDPVPGESPAAPGLPWFSNLA